MKKTGCILLAASLLVLLSACDSFSLTDQFSRSAYDGFTLSLSNTSIIVDEQTQLYPLRGVAPYSFAVIGTDLSPTTQANPVGLTYDSSGKYYYRAGSAIGRITIQVVDAENKSASAQVTVLPPKVEGVEASYAGPPYRTITLSWTYNYEDLIDSYEITGSIGVDPIVPKTTDNTYRTALIEGVSANVPYNLTIRAVSGSYESQAVFIAGSTQ